MKSIKYNKDKILYFLLSLVLITLPFPSYSLNSKAIILLAIYWLFYNSLSEKISLLKQNKHSYYLFATLFLVLLFSVFFSDNYLEGLRLLNKRTALILLPLIILTIKINKQTVNFLLYYFSLSVIISSFFALIKVLFFKFNNLGDYLNYSSFGQLLEKHTTYFALFTVISILYFINQISNSKKYLIIQLSTIIYLLLIIYFLSVRISIVALVISAFILLIKINIQKGKYIAWSFLLLGIIFFMSPNFQKRFHSTKDHSAFYDITYRYKHLKTIVIEVTNKSSVFGFGLGSDRTSIYKAYKDNGLVSAFKEKYNAHNQYIEYYAHFGIIGALVFFTVNVLIIRYFYLKQKWLYLSIFMFFIIFMLTESILERHSGLILYVFLTSLFLSERSIGVSKNLN